MPGDPGACAGGLTRARRGAPDPRRALCGWTVYHAEATAPIGLLDPAALGFEDRAGPRLTAQALRLREGMNLDALLAFDGRHLEDLNHYLHGFSSIESEAEDDPDDD